MRSLQSILVPIVAIFLAQSVADARLWTDLTGKHRFEAELVNVNDTLDTATFVGSNGKEYEIPVEALSLKDQKFALKSQPRRVTRKQLTISDIPNEVMYKIKQAALNLWPDDEDMQADEITTASLTYLQQHQQKNAPPNKSGNTTGGIPAAIVEQVTSQAATDWPEDNQAQQEQAARQLGYYRILKNYRTKKLPALVVVQIKHNARKVAPGDYRAQLVYLNKQINAGVDYLAKLDADEAAAKAKAAAETESIEKLAAVDHQVASPNRDGTNTFYAFAPATAPTETLVPSIFIQQHVPAARDASYYYYPETLVTRSHSSLACQRCRPSSVRRNQASSTAAGNNKASNSWKWFARTQSK